MRYVDYMGTGPLDLALDRRIGQLLAPYYGNIHSDSLCSYVMNELIEYARDIVKSSFVENKDDFCVIFTGNGATGAARHFSHLIECEIGTIVTTVMEHLSNSTMWKYTIPDAKMQYVPVKRTVFDLNVFKKMVDDAVKQCPNVNKKVLVAVTACSNVLGSIQPVDKILTYIKKRYGDKVIACVDCAACTPYVDLRALLRDNFDAAIASPHKFKGGNSTPGILVVKKKFVNTNRVPFFPGGGTVWFSDSKCSLFSQDVQKREEGGSKNMLGVIKTGILFKRKNKKLKFIRDKNRQIIRHADAFFKKNKNIVSMLTDLNTTNRLPVYSFIVKDTFPSFIVKALSDMYGIQARSGVSCCFMLSDHMKQLTVQQRQNIVKGKGPPNTFGWVRLSFHYDNDLKFVSSVLNDLKDLLDNMKSISKLYEHVKCTNEWKLKKGDDTKKETERFVSEFFDDLFFFSDKKK
jgi:selenocysteine lyase/cysteine desulfurase